jgi:UDP-N-acetylglucosamine--N-acetylmuramyl-(pentapeptide) pyrophosphoryl-undecaprenol N-acetylglucosamine transferase
VSRPTILIAGGGTGGHVFPGVAVAEALAELGDVDVVFFGTDRGLEARVVPARGWRLERIRVEPMRGGGPGRAARCGVVAARATIQSFARVRTLRPRAVLSVGGYASGPVSLAAALLGVPIAVLEPNTAVGLANRVLGPLAQRAYIAWDEAAGSFRRGALRRYGVPLRRGFAARPYVAGRSARILVMGGSRGAAVLNARMPEAIGRVVGRFPWVEVLHQAGRDEDGDVRTAYARTGVAGAVVVPFVDDVARAIGEADIVVARAGAGTIAEITSIGRASLLVPFPYAADDHQRKNAEAMLERGAATWVNQSDADPVRLACEIESLLGDDGGRVAMADAARTRGRPNAARDVAADLLDLAAGGH